MENTDPSFMLTTAACAVAEHTPLVQCITNTVVQQFTANALLAAGASPAMLDHEADAGQFAGIANGLLVNFGTATSHQFLGAEAAVEVANHIGTPWVLDPVSVGAIDYRTSRIRAMATRRPTAVRGNASEVAALAGMGLGGRGVDSTDSVEAVLPAALSLADRTGGVVGVSGEVDAIVRIDSDGTGVAATGAAATGQVARVHGGSELMPLVIGTGCSLGATVAAYLGAAKASDELGEAGTLDADAAFWATVAAHAHFAAAGARAAGFAQAPGSYATAFLDALYTVSAEDIGAVRVDLETAEVPVTAPADEAEGIRA
ncbi:hydroxyethylthiazole kinase [Brevibacterium litoralis]|uniref:hydroxyethylthiazole kinase n=1 Tax=Brevibacterium litoralis TaxID=3138935 RepID=UPI0032EB957D